MENNNVEKLITGEKVFICTYCDKVFSTALSLKIHLPAHTGEKSYICDVCGKVYPRATSLCRHMHTHSERKPYECTECGKGFNQLDHLKRHLFMHTGQKPVACQLCDKRFRREWDLKVHMRQHNKDDPFCCNICKKTFIQKQNLKSHMKIHSDFGSHPSESHAQRSNDQMPQSGYNYRNVDNSSGCSSSFSGVANFNEKAVAYTVGNYNSPAYNQAFPQMGSMDVPTHTKEMPHAYNATENNCLSTTAINSDAQCSEENKEKVSEENTSTNGKKYSKGVTSVFRGPVRYTCSNCAETFITLALLKEHMEIHTDQKTYVCSTCNTGFLCLNALKTHMRTHFHVCNECGKSCTNSYLLREHMRTHTGETPYECSTCSKSFRTRNYLNAHMHSHRISKIVKKIYTCSSCNVGFNKADALKKHMCKDSREKGYSCSRCDKAFSELKSLKVHVKGSHPEDNENEGRRCECPKCGKQLKNDRSLRRHHCFATTHSSMKCTLCQTIFSKASNYEKHMLNHKEQKGCICTECNKLFPDMSQLKRHMPRHTGERPYSCCDCDKTFKESSALRKHELCHTTNNVDKLFLCLTCDQKFAWKESLEEHIATHDTEQLSSLSLAKSDDEKQDSSEITGKVCAVCNKVFPTISRLKRHMKMHSDYKPHICTICNKSFSEAGNLKKHNSNVHDANKLLPCMICGHKFISKKTLDDHMTIHIDVGSDDEGSLSEGYDEPIDTHKQTRQSMVFKGHACDVCKKAFVTAYRLKRHIKTHTNTKTYVCNICNKGFSETGNLNKHIAKVHDGKQRFPCLRCDQRFVLEETLDNHMATHVEVGNDKEGSLSKNVNEPKDEKRDGDLPSENLQAINSGKGTKKVDINVEPKVYVCKICDKVFNYSYNLKVHMPTHTGGTAFICHVCGKGFPRATSLSRHKRIHTGERPYLCYECGKSFNQIQHLRRHQAMHRGERPVACDFCDKRFRRNWDLKIHMRQHQDIILQTNSKTGIKPINNENCSTAFNQMPNQRNQTAAFIGEKPYTSTGSSETPNFDSFLGQTGVEFIKAGPSYSDSSLHNHDKEKELTRKTESVTEQTDSTMASANRGPKNYTCSICKEVCPGLDLLKKHMKKHTDEKTYICSNCNTGFLSLEVLRTHMSNTHFHVCSVCNRKYYSSWRLRLHMRTHTEKERRKCPYCALMFKSVTGLKHHLQNHMGQQPNVVNKVSSESGGGKRNLPEQGSARPYKCSLCFKIFMGSSDLRLHLNEAHTEDYFMCTKCGKNLKNALSLKRHQSVHLSECALTCSVCHRLFSTASSYEQHMKVHREMKGSACNVCHKLFPNGSRLKRHMRMHSNERPFRCSVCGKAYRESGVLKQHMRTHTGEKPYVCTVCDLRFMFKRSLGCHMQKHGGQPRNVCLYCDKKFKHVGSLKTHMRHVHGIDHYSGCGVCVKGFRSKIELEHHLKSHRRAVRVPRSLQRSLS